jgi:PadR family transcriptional regulator PadR
VSTAQDAIAKWEVQVRKGVLEMVVLLTVRAAETYGYELITDITRSMNFELTEGTIYPLLSRLHKEELIAARWVEAAGGVPRKYYRITPRGRAAIEAMEASWTRLTGGVQRLASKTHAEADRRRQASHR